MMQLINIPLVNFLLFSGCEPNDKGPKWGLPIQGRRIPLADMIRFPAILKHQTSKWVSKQPCGLKGNLLFDFEAFQVDQQSQLIYTRHSAVVSYSKVYFHFEVSY